MSDHLFSAGALILSGAALITNARMLERSGEHATARSRITLGLGALVALLGAVLIGWTLGRGGLQ
ncbi:Uncharacterised protein [Mycobacteroides abscessus subsp. abscessus]|uniref:hypothetical protein n=1 Tax=Mycobacteroides abscessus TaxID=36809 RepID=UPI00092A33B1|nr:hypothetical protein [Mycobacteroides abscessus]SIJ03511.1 Uncharacterised protein [Mycobacteroides abscessus subsp. abscessus]SIN15270.1 Uncharacterised protein [Mycobacteroides abscessus subsp. abscessus]